MYTTLYIILGILIVLSLILTITLVPRKQQNQDLDDGISITTKHPIIANPIYIAYGVLFIVILAAIAYYALRS